MSAGCLVIKKFCVFKGEGILDTNKPGCKRGRRLLKIVIKKQTAHARIYCGIALSLLLLTSCATADNGRNPVLPGTVREFLDENGWDMGGYSASSLKDSSLYQDHHRAYSAAMNPEDLWDIYTNLDPRAAWQGGIITFGLLYSPRDKRVYTMEDAAVPGFSAGQIYMLDLKLAGFYHIPVAFQISKINHETRFIEFIYLEQNHSNGVQQIRFFPFENSDGTISTRIEHHSRYSSGSSFRDKILYPPFHNQTIDSFHRNVIKSAGLEFTVFL